MNQPAVRPRRAQPFARLRRDHREVFARIDALEHDVLRARRSGPLPVRALRSLVARLSAQFATHMTAEDEVLFPALERTFDGAAAVLAPLREEHADLRSLLASIAERLQQPRSRERDERLAVDARDLVDLLRIHVRKEERIVFRVMERVLGPEELADLAARLVPFQDQDQRSAPHGRRKGGAS